MSEGSCMVLHGLVTCMGIHIASVKVFPVLFMLEFIVCVSKE